MKKMTLIIIGANANLKLLTFTNQFAFPLLSEKLARMFSRKKLLVICMCEHVTGINKEQAPHPFVI